MAKTAQGLYTRQAHAYRGKTRDASDQLEIADATSEK